MIDRILRALGPSREITGEPDDDERRVEQEEISAARARLREQEDERSRLLQGAIDRQVEFHRQQWRYFERRKETIE